MPDVRKESMGVRRGPRPLPMREDRRCSYRRGLRRARDNHPLVYQGVDRLQALTVVNREMGHERASITFYIINGAGRFCSTWEFHQPLRAGRAGDTGAEPETSQLGYVWDSARLLETEISTIVCDER